LIRTSRLCRMCLKNGKQRFYISKTSIYGIEYSFVEGTIDILLRKRTCYRLDVRCPELVTDAPSAIGLDHVRSSDLLTRKNSHHMIKLSQNIPLQHQKHISCNIYHHGVNIEKHTLQHKKETSETRKDKCCTSVARWNT
jgi:hypothetical protein